MVKLEEIIDIIKTAAPGISDFDPEISFKENGIDSLDLMNILLAVEEKFELKFSDADLEEMKFARDVTAILERRSARNT